MDLYTPGVILAAFCAGIVFGFGACYAIRHLRAIEDEPPLTVRVRADTRHFDEAIDRATERTRLAKMFGVGDG